MILDGEIVAFDASGKPSFAALQNRVQFKTEREIAAVDRTSPAVFFCFDLLYFAGIDLRKAPYRKRRAISPNACCLLPWCNWCTRRKTGLLCTPRRSRAASRG